MIYFCTQAGRTGGCKFITRLVAERARTASAQKGTAAAGSAIPEMNRSTSLMLRSPSSLFAATGLMLLGDDVLGEELPDTPASARVKEVITPPIPFLFTLCDGHFALMWSFATNRC